jgi:protein regulator of cytokinesis 1
MTTNSAATPAITPESLVQELLPQITLQTAQLPTLYTQLGLASSALEQDLETLRKALLNTVEDVVHAREKEVQEWADRCDKLEDSCIRLSKALGPSAKSVGATVGELCKQPVSLLHLSDGLLWLTLLVFCSRQVYPRRFELLTEQEDKLLKLYTSKLEQLHALTARLATSARTLGKNFYSSEILKPTPASSQKEYADSWRDVTAERFNWLEKELTRGRAEVVRCLFLYSPC